MKTNFMLRDFLFWSDAALFRLGHLNYVVNVAAPRSTPDRCRAAWRGLMHAMRCLQAAAQRWLGYLTARP